MEVKKRYNANNFRECFYDFKLDNPAGFFIRNKTSFSGLFGNYSQLAYDRNFTQETINKIKDISKVIGQVEFINNDFQDLDLELRDYFIYFDPPYYSNKNVGLYGEKGKLHKHFNHEALKDFVDYYSVDNQIMISYDDCEYIRNLYQDYFIYDFDFAYSMTNVNHNKCKIGKELIITNYEVNWGEYK